MPPPSSSSPVVRTRRKHTTHHISPILGTQKGPLRFPEIDGPAPPPFLFLLFIYAFLSLRNVDKCGSASLDSLQSTLLHVQYYYWKSPFIKASPYPTNGRRIKTKKKSTAGTSTPYYTRYVCAAQFTTNKKKLTKSFSYNLGFPSFRPLNIYSRSRCVFSLLID